MEEAFAQNVSRRCIFWENIPIIDSRPIVNIALILI